MLDPGERTLRRDGRAVELGARYLDALVLMVEAPGALVSKERFLQEIWGGVPVTDEALTQCIRALRRQLGDDAARPRFIETVPKHGYRFIAPVERVEAERPNVERVRSAWRRAFMIAGAGTVGAGIAGLIAGLLYGALGAAQQSGSTVGGTSVLLVLLWLSLAVALVGGAGVSIGVAAAGALRGGAWPIAGGAAGGLIIGGVVKVLGLDAFNLLLGRSPADFTGAPEGVLVGAAVGLGAWLAANAKGKATLARRVAVAAGAGGVGGAVVVLSGGQMLAGSLDLLARAFPSSRLRVDLFGEATSSAAAPVVGGALEGALFAACIVAAMLMAARSLDEAR